MKAVEFKSRIKNKTIKVPDNLTTELSEDKDIRVIVLMDEIENKNEVEYQNLVQEQFLEGYSDSDAIYDDY